MLKLESFKSIPLALQAIIYDIETKKWNPKFKKSVFLRVLTNGSLLVVVTFDTRINNQMNTYKIHYLKKIHFSATQAIKSNRHGTKNGLHELSFHQSKQPHLVNQ